MGSEVPAPLQPNTFAREIPGINDTASYDIWRILRDSRYLIEDNEKVDLSLGYGEKGESFIHPGLFYEFRRFSTACWMHELTLERLLGTYFSLKQSVSKSDLQDAFVKWFSSVRNEKIQEDISEIIEFLEREYLKNPFTKKFNDSLNRYKSFIPDIARILSEHFAKQLGEAEFDIKSYNIDANGNHENYHTGFDYYRLSYHNNTNQINSIKFDSCASSRLGLNFSIKHDSRGNVIQALHKGIERIDYNPISNRATKIQLTDGKTLTFYYNAQGERVLKRVANSEGQTTKEIHYIRDEFGRAFVEREVTFIAQDLPPDVLATTYIYGPRGLLGFIRRDEFYSVITDHEGSIRLVVKGDEVVAAYDYLPYGNSMREYGSDPEAHISYRYTGQELDEETGLYNYHTRFYDPSIGRFYQIDPKGQYFSPYKYASNSPVSVVDPDGEFALLITAIILGITGAYLGGSSANDDWNPGEWEWKSGKTWAGMIGGGIGGTLLPVGFGTSVGTFAAMGLSNAAATGVTVGLGAGGAYLGMAEANTEWDLSKWDYIA